MTGLGVACKGETGWCALALLQSADVLEGVVRPVQVAQRGRWTLRRSAWVAAVAAAAALHPPHQLGRHKDKRSRKHKHEEQGDRDHRKQKRKREHKYEHKHKRRHHPFAEE